jgi:putative lipase involved disintegration of autophagic bodies
VERIERERESLTSTPHSFLAIRFRVFRIKGLSPCQAWEAKWFYCHWRRPPDDGDMWIIIIIIHIGCCCAVFLGFCSAEMSECSRNNANVSRQASKTHLANVV